MTLAVKAKRAEIDECHVRIAVVAGGKRLEEVAMLLQQHGIVPLGLEHDGVARLVLVGVLASLDARVDRPLRRGDHRVIHARNAEGHLLAGLDPGRRLGIENVPAIDALLRFQVGPRQAHVDDSRPRHPFERVARLLLRAVGPDAAGVVEVHEPHAGIRENFVSGLRLHHGGGEG